jgi:indolepyruvate ferredoxin oxidoreductase alpha subunit
MEVAFGASLAGARSVCAMKHVGLNVAADPLFTLSYTGVTGGMVICVADDPAMHSSQNEQDSRHYAIAAKVPMLEPSDSAECLSYAKEAFRISEEFDTPVLLRLTTRVAHSQSIVELGERISPEKKPYEKKPEKYIMVPANAKRRHPIVEERTASLTAFAETSPLNRLELRGTECGIITSGTCYQYVREALGEDVSVLKLGMVNPLPVELIREFSKKVKRLIVIEELDGIIEGHCRSIGVAVEGKSIFSPIGEYNQATIAAAFGFEAKPHVVLESDVPVRPPMMCAGCPHRGIFYTLAKNKITVLGDIGCYTLGAQPPLSALDSTLCMGASISGLHGFRRATDDKHPAACVIGDSTFIHSGITGLIDIAYNGSASVVIILDNSITGMTGHQQNPTTGYNIKGDPAGKIDLEALCHAIGIRRVRVVDPYDLAACETAIKEELAAGEASVIISRRPCVLLKTVKPKPPVKVSPDACRGCKKCLSLGCPAISFKNKRATVNETLCVGCGICEQLCPFDAISGTV